MPYAEKGNCFFSPLILNILFIYLNKVNLEIVDYRGNNRRSKTGVGYAPKESRNGSSS